MGTPRSRYGYTLCCGCAKLVFGPGAIPARNMERMRRCKRVQRLMRSMFLAGMAPGPNTSLAHPQHKVYPYLLRGVPIVRANQVWSTDITYVRLEPVSYTHLRAHETDSYLVCRL